MQKLRCVEIAAWIAGLALLTAYGGFRAWSAMARAEGVAAIEQSSPGSSIPLVSSATRVAIATPGNVVPVSDTSAWSQNRLLAWRDAVRQPGVPEALLRIPSLGLLVPVYDGTNELNLNRGAARIEGTAQLWENGNVGLAAHRDGYFRVLKDVRIGEELYLQSSTQTVRYRIVSTQIVDPEDIHVLASTDVATVTLVTCYPFYFVGSAPQRFIVRAQVIEEADTILTAQRKVHDARMLADRTLE